MQIWKELRKATTSKLDVTLPTSYMSIWESQYLYQIFFYIFIFFQGEGTNMLWNELQTFQCLSMWAAQ